MWSHNYSLLPLGAAKENETDELSTIINIFLNMEFVNFVMKEGNMLNTFVKLNLVSNTV